MNPSNMRPKATNRAYFRGTTLGSEEALLAPPQARAIGSFGREVERFGAEATGSGQRWGVSSRGFSSCLARDITSITSRSRVHRESGAHVRRVRRVRLVADGGHVTVRRHARSKNSLPRVPNNHDVSRKTRSRTVARLDLATSRTDGGRLSTLPDVRRSGCVRSKRSQRSPSALVHVDPGQLAHAIDLFLRQLFAAQVPVHQVARVIAMYEAQRVSKLVRQGDLSIIRPDDG